MWLLFEGSVELPIVWLLVFISLGASNCVATIRGQCLFHSELPIVWLLVFISLRASNCVAAIRGWRLFHSELPIVWLLFEGSVYFT